MYFKATYRHNPKTDKSDWYFRLVESYRKVFDEVRPRTVLSVGFLSDFNCDQIDQIEKQSVPVNSKNKSGKTKDLFTT